MQLVADSGRWRWSSWVCLWWPLVLVAGADSGRADAGRWSCSKLTLTATNRSNRKCRKSQGAEIEQVKVLPRVWAACGGRAFRTETAVKK